MSMHESDYVANVVHETDTMAKKHDYRPQALVYF